MSRQLAVSIDLDPVPCYYRIHALGEPPPELRDVVMRRGLPRLAALLAARGLPATWFVVGHDLDEAEVGAPAAAATREALRARVEAGDELGNHSLTHPYELARLGEAAVARELGGCDDRLRAITGRPIVGFRAPGYDLSPRMLAELSRRAYLYDSSIFPAPAYYAAKAAVMAGLELSGRPSGAVMTEPRALAAPTTPYRPAMGAPWRRGQAAVVELPIMVTPWLRLPAIGTTLLTMPAWLRARVLAGTARSAFFNLELHGIDACDAELDGIPGELVARQPDLRLPLDRKLAILDAILDELTRDRDGVTLRTVAAAVQRGHH
ncbi:MAG TPA: polysaccharide deacetylase family protein [Kofleriaceae bacterium]|nr:polysaccharide deacetylase family protein [Kofleriaceae bacterium]